jgi:hypothetical protein
VTKITCLVSYLHSKCNLWIGELGTDEENDKRSPGKQAIVKLELNNLKI